MRRVRRSGTTPEMVVRSVLHRVGLRFSVDRPELPGKPDIVLRRWKTVIFVHGCFWHRHAKCARASVPSTRTDYWLAKFRRNEERDLAAVRRLRRAGWRVLIIWECETRNRDALSIRIGKMFGRRS